MNLENHPGCTKCDLHFTCKSVGIPTRFLGPGEPFRHDRALLVVGKAPGWDEDQAGVCWVGQSGTLLQKAYVGSFDLPSKVDVWVGNVCRCRPPEDDTLSDAQKKACLPYLQEDIDFLEKHYQEVWILCCGAEAAWAFGYKSLGASFKTQGDHRTPRLEKQDG